MGVKNLWSVFSPYSDRKPISELSGKKVAIDLSGWVCESLNVVDYFVHPRHHLKNLFFRTSYLIWERVTPVFVLEGVAPELKSQVIAKRNEIQFRGARPKTTSESAQRAPPNDKGRTRFNNVLKQCETLLLSMGIQCVQAPGEAEAYCAFLNKRGLVDGVISQDSDCFAYGAVCVYRNFSLSSQGAQAAAGGAVDIYDMRRIGSSMDFGQNKVIAMALLCGCDYCPEGVDGVGKDSVLKLFHKHKDGDILTRLRGWRLQTKMYTNLEMRVDEKEVCSDCGHIGRLKSHKKSGCATCQTSNGCNSHIWKEERLSIKAELTLRNKALKYPDFPNEEIITEFLNEPDKEPNLCLDWKQPNVVVFIKKIGHMLQWSEIYCLQKFFPLITRWYVQQMNPQLASNLVKPLQIIKKRTVKGVASLEMQWEVVDESFKRLIPEKQIKEFELEHPKGIDEIYTTIEPLTMLESAYPDLVNAFLKSKEKPPKRAKVCKLDTKSTIPICNAMDLDLASFKSCIPANISGKSGKNKPKPKKVQQRMERFLHLKRPSECSTPIQCRPFDYDTDLEEDEQNCSNIINGMISSANDRIALSEHKGRVLHYESVADDLSMRLSELNIDENRIYEYDGQLVRLESVLDLTPDFTIQAPDDSYDMLVKWGERKPPRKSEDGLKLRYIMHPVNVANESFFFNRSRHEGVDAFEKVMDVTMGCDNELPSSTDSESD